MASCISAAVLRGRGSLDATLLGCRHLGLGLVGVLLAVVGRRHLALGGVGMLAALVARVALACVLPRLALVLRTTSVGGVVLTSAREKLCRGTVDLALIALACKRNNFTAQAQPQAPSPCPSPSPAYRRGVQRTGDRCTHVIERGALCTCSPGVDRRRRAGLLAVAWASWTAWTGADVFTAAGAFPQSPYLGASCGN